MKYAGKPILVGDPLRPPVPHYLISAITDACDVMTMF